MGTMHLGSNTQSSLPDQLPTHPHAVTSRAGQQGRFWRWLAFGMLLALLGGLLWLEAQSSFLQSRFLSAFASGLTYHLGDGANQTPVYPTQGPFDERLGYVALPELLPKLQAAGYRIDHQAVFSDALRAYAGEGFYAPYVEKSRAGLDIADCRGESMYHYRYPQRGYVNFDTIPPLIAISLLFIENRDLLDTDTPFQNPSVNWERFAKAVVLQAVEALGFAQPPMGGSTLATQIEKYRHSDQGLTSSVFEKLRQMTSGSVRAYQQGPETLAVRRSLVRDYLNSVPLSAAPGHGEVNGLGDGLWVWFGADFEQVNRLLAQPAGEGELLRQQGLALRQVIALMISQRRPSYYLAQGQLAQGQLAQGRDELTALSASYLRLLAQSGQISQGLRDAAIEQPLIFRDFSQHPPVVPQAVNKGVNVARTRLSRLLGAPLYALDRMDLAATSSLRNDLQQDVERYLRSLRQPEVAAAAGLLGERLLKSDQVGALAYSFTLFERTAQANRVRVQTDNTDQPFDINEGSKLELGSTAKLRVLTTYLEIIAEMYHQYAGQSPEALRKLDLESQDRLARWLVDQLIATPDATLPQVLDAAMQRTYSASPAERFYTGGGVHTFHNFRKEDDGRTPTLREALQESINLPFVRLLRDLLWHSRTEMSDDIGKLLSDDRDPRRDQYIDRFADHESLVFLRRFWQKYAGKTEEARLDTFLDGLKPTANRLSAVHRFIFPDADLSRFSAFIRQQLPDHKISDKVLTSLYQQYGPQAFNIRDQGYIARVHPLELWLVAYLQQHPDASFTEAAAASKVERLDIYNWLRKARAKNARDIRVRTMMEVEAFEDIQQRWQRLGYPFDHLVPSLATALGSSGDRPAALAELMGIILNDGVRLPALRIDQLHFAADTPYEVALSRLPEAGQRVMAPEVAATLRDALSAVVNDGTARRIRGSFKAEDGGALIMGGKTGTGDNRLVRIGADGSRNAQQAKSRTATFVFYLGDHFFGTLTAFVLGGEAADFSFTSALPVQVLKSMAPILQPYLAQTCSDALPRLSQAASP